MAKFKVGDLVKSVAKEERDIEYVITESVTYVNGETICSIRPYSLNATSKDEIQVSEKMLRSSDSIKTFNEYQCEAMRTASGMSCASPDNLLLNGVMGLNGEAGEAIDIVKKHMFQGHELNREHIAKELSDCMWYIAVAAEGCGFTLEEIVEMNVKKLRARYPNGFEAERSLHRAEGDI